MNRKRFLSGGLVMILLFLSGCQPSTVISTLEAVISAAEIALPIISAAIGLSPVVSGQIIQYLQAVDAAVVQASVILAGPGTSAEKATRIAEVFVAVAAGCKCIPPGTPAAVVAVVDGVVRAIARFLANIQPPPGARTAAPNIKISGADRTALIDIRKRAEANMVQLKGARKP